MTILIVDDNEPNLYQLQVLLNGSGYQVVIAANGAEALAKARQDPPDLIVSDILMPVMDGFALCREWKKDEGLRHIPFVFYTASYTDERDRRFGLSLGAEQFLVKPDEAENLIPRIQEVLQHVRRPSAGPVPAPIQAPQREEESSYLKHYNEVLIHKLEAKMERLAQANRQLERDIAERLDYQRRLRSLASELSLAEERERRRIAAGLHDHACQTLVMSKMKLQQLQASLPPGDRERVEDILSMLDQTIESVREMTFDLSSPTLYRFGLEAALQELLKDKLRPEHHIHCVFRDDATPKPLAEDVRVVLFQAVRELLVNMVKHARAHEVALDISRFHDSITITVADDGVGFDPASLLAAPSKAGGFGLFNIRERLDFIGGTLDVNAEPGRGSRFTLTAPLETREDADKETHHGHQDPVG
jgi:signal transduction histidine kinase